MKDDKFKEYFAPGEKVNGGPVPSSNESFKAPRSGVPMGDLKRGLTEGPKKFNVIEDDMYERMPQGHDRI